MAARVSTKLWATGQRVTGLAELHQSVRTIILTQRRSVPHDPERGVDWLAVLDRPVQLAVPALALDVREQLRRYERRIRVTRVVVTPTVEPGRFETAVYWVPAGAENEERTIA